MKKIISLIFAFLIFFPCALSEDINDHITIIEERTGDIQNPVPPKPFKPAHLDEVGKVTIGQDNRTTVSETGMYPFSAIAYIDVTSGCSHGGWYGSGFLISNDLLLTAGHIVYCPVCHAPAQKIVFYFGYVNERNYLACNAGNNWRVFVPRQVAEGRDYSDCDYAIFQLDEDIGETTGYFSLRYDVPDEELTGLSFQVAGYKNGILKHGIGKVFPQSRQYLAHYADMESGNSGCPVYDSNYYVIAINSAEAEDGSQNYAVRITGDMYGQIEKYGGK